MFSLQFGFRRNSFKKPSIESVLWPLGLTALLGLSSCFSSGDHRYSSEHDDPSAILGSVNTDSPPAPLGEALFVARCVGCHASESLTLVSPLLNGLPSGYIAKQLNRFKMGVRRDFLMAGAMNEVTQSLSDQEVETLSEYLGNSDTCQIPNSAVDPQGGRVELGAELFSTNACLACHNDESQSIRPLLRGQRTLYLAQQLMAFRDKDRPDFTMSRIAGDLSDEQILDLSAYINSLSGCVEPTP